MVAQNVNVIVEKSEENSVSFNEMNLAFQEIAEGTANQMESTLSINDSVQQTNQMLDSMNRMLEQLGNEIGETGSAAQSGGVVVEKLYQFIGEFKKAVASMEADIEQLTGKIIDASAFSGEIKDIAKHRSGKSGRAWTRVRGGGERDPQAGRDVRSGGGANNV